MNGILAIDTASAGGIALAYRAASDGPAAVFTSEGMQDHSRQLIPAIEELLAGAKRGLAAIGVVTGPGSYAGLRVGIATAESLAFGLAIPVYGATTFELIAAVADGRASVLVHPAGRGEFAIQRLDGGQPHAPPAIVAEDRLPDGPLAGEGVAHLGGLDVSREQRAAALVEIAGRRWLDGERAGGIEAYYLREPNITRPKRTPLVAPGGRRMERADG